MIATVVAPGRCWVAAALAGPVVLACACARARAALSEPSARGTPKWHLVAYGYATGDQAVATASLTGISGFGPADHQAVEFLVATAPPTLRVDVTWNLYRNGKTTGAGGHYTGTFTKTVTKAPGCAGDLSGDTSASGTVRVWIYAR